MKALGIVLLIAGLIGLGAQITWRVRACYQYDKTYDALWTMADRASTIDAKEVKLTEFVTALKSGWQRGEFSDNAALVLRTPQNSFTANLSAVQSLVDRLHQIHGMSPMGFEYQVAIQQITAQEQGEAKEMIEVFYGCWLVKNHLFVWGPIGGGIAAILVIMVVFGITIVLDSFC